MNKFMLIIVGFFLLVGSAVAEMVTVELRINNISNFSDQYKVRKILSVLEGVRKVIIIDGNNNVLISFENEQSSLFDIKTALAAQGYPTTETIP